MARRRERVDGLTDMAARYPTAKMLGRLRRICLALPEAEDGGALLVVDYRAFTHVGMMSLEWRASLELVDDIVTAIPHRDRTPALG